MTLLAEHGAISIAFRVEQVLEASPIRGGLAGIGLEERRIRPTSRTMTPFGARVLRDGRSALTSRTGGLLGAHLGDTRVGGAVLAFDTAGVDMLGGRTDLAVLWDLRVHLEHGNDRWAEPCSMPPRRGQGHGGACSWRSRPRTTTSRRVGSTRRWDASCAASTGSRIPICLMRPSSCGQNVSCREPPRHAHGRSTNL